MLKKILFLKHVAIEGPGTLGAFVQNAGYQIEEVDLFAGALTPKDISSFAAVVSLGGPMNVYQEDRYPFLKEEDLLIKKVLAANIPFLGICLGSQLLAKACGAAVGKSPGAEIGFFDISLTQDGCRDRIFDHVDPPLRVFQWHEDMFEIPSGAVWLSRSNLCPHQAFRAGDRAYGFQFHVEIDRAMIIAWMKKYWKVDHVLDCEKARDILSQYDQAQPQLCQVAEQVYNNFAAIIDQAG